MEFLHKWMPTIWNFMNESKAVVALIIVAAVRLFVWAETLSG